MRSHLVLRLGALSVSCSGGAPTMSNGINREDAGCASVATPGEEDQEDALSFLQGPASARGRHVHSPTVGAIPKIVHHIYKTNLEHGPWPYKIWETSYASWKTFFPEPEYTHFFWSDNDMDVFFEKRCRRHWKTYNDEERYIVRSDLSRYCLLSKIGGIYADLDYQVRRNFFKHLEPGKVNLVESPYLGETVQNSLMASPPGLPYWEKLMDLVDSRSVPEENILLAAGPRLFDKLPDTHDEAQVHVLPCNRFQRATHTSNGQDQEAANKGCLLLNFGWDDDKLMGIHWGTSSYFEQADSRDIMYLFDEVQNGVGDDT